LAVVRPPAIYGPGDRETLAAFRWAASGAPLPLPGRARVALAHVDDVVATLIAVAQNPELSATYAVGGARPEGYEWREVLEAAARAVGRRARFLPAPGPLVWSAGALSEAFGGLAGRAPMFTRGKAREFLHQDWSVAPEDEAPGAPKARFDLDQGFAETVAWYRDHGWLS